MKVESGQQAIMAANQVVQAGKAQKKHLQGLDDEPKTHEMLRSLAGGETQEELVKLTGIPKGRVASVLKKLREERVPGASRAVD